MIIRSARAGEGELLSELTFRSKLYWGYDDSFMEKAREDLAISEKTISSNYVYVMELAKRIIGLFCLIINDEKKELDAFFIEPEFIGMGYGRILWEAVLNKAKDLGVNELTVIADPHAEGFYNKMGAIRIGEFNSSIFKNRKLPLMKVVIQ